MFESTTLGIWMLERTIFGSLRLENTILGVWRQGLRESQACPSDPFIWDGVYQWSSIVVHLDCRSIPAQRSDDDDWHFILVGILHSASYWFLGQELTIQACQLLMYSLNWKGNSCRNHGNAMTNEYIFCQIKRHVELWKWMHFSRLLAQNTI